MKLLLLLLLAASARADLTMPIVSADEKPASAAPEADGAFGPMAGTWSGTVRCPGDAENVSLKFDTVDLLHKGRVFIIYTLKAASHGGYAAGLILTPTGKEGVYDAHDGGGRLPDLRAEVHGHVLTLRPPPSRTLDLTHRVEARMAFDGRWRSAMVTARQGDGSSCMGALRRSGGS